MEYWLGSPRRASDKPRKLEPELCGFVRLFSAIRGDGLNGQSRRSIVKFSQIAVDCRRIAFAIVFGFEATDTFGPILQTGRDNR